MTGMSNVTKLAGEPSGQEFLVFTLGDEEYGIDILKVQEIRGYDQVTRIANTPAFIKGVTNLRGVIVPIVDLRVKFSQGDVDYNDNTVVYTDVNKTATAGTYARMSVVDIYEQVGKMVRTDLGWVSTDDLL